MDTSNPPSGKQVAENSHGTRRNTRSTSNQEKEKESADSKNNSVNGTNKDNESNESGKKRQKERVVRGQNGEVLEYTTEDDITYRPQDSAYLTTERPDNPYFICTIQEIKVSKRDNAIVSVKWYYRPTEVPDLVYQMLVKDRLHQVADTKIKDLLLKPEVVNRELFVADHETTDTYPISCLRGKCEVSYYSSIKEIKDFELRPDHFFYIFTYNPETRRLASTKGETRVGPSHQWNASTRGIFQKAQLPDLLKPSEQADYERDNRVYEEMTWEPKVNYCDLIMCLRAARSLAAFAGVCDGVSPEEGCIVASRDDTTINALRVLYENNGNPRKAIDALVKNPVPVTIESKWTEEQVKRFQRGLRLHGKDFFKIRKELLPMKETGELVEFYYLWKKTQDGLMIRPHRKHRRQAAMKKGNKKMNSTNGSGDQTSTEEETEESEESEKETNNFTCKHCNSTTSKDWLVGGKEGVMLCTECRIFYKKYGENRPVVKVEDIDSASEGDSDTPPAANNQMPPFLFKPIKEEKMTNLIARKPAKSLAKVNAVPELKKPNKRQWSDSEEVPVKQEDVSTNLKRPKTEKEEVDNRLQTNRDSGTEVSSPTQMSSESNKEGPAVDTKPFSSSSHLGIIPGHSTQAFATSSIAYASTITSSFTESPSDSLTKSTSVYQLKSIASVSSSGLTPFIPTGHKAQPGMAKLVPDDTLKAHLGLNVPLVPRNGVHSTVAYFGSTTPPINPTLTSTAGQQSSTYYTSGTTTVSTAHVVRSSPTVEQTQQSRSPKPPQVNPSDPQHASHHPGGSRQIAEAPHPANRQSPNPIVAQTYYRPTAVKSEAGAYRPPNPPVPDSYRRNPRFPFDPLVTDQIISNANTSRVSVKEERGRTGSPPKMGQEHHRPDPVRPPNPHLFPPGGSPTPHIKVEPRAGSSSGPQHYGPMYKRGDPHPQPGHHEHQRMHPQSPNPHGSHLHPGHPGPMHPAQHAASVRHAGQASPTRQSSSSVPTTMAQAQDRDDSDVELISESRTASPPPAPTEVLTHHGNSARFIKIWNRGPNSCFRTDYIFAPDRVSVQKRTQAQQQHLKPQQQQPTTQSQQEHPGQPQIKHQRTHSRSHTEHEKRREEKQPESSDRARREGPGPLSSSHPAQPHINTPGHSSAPRSTPARTPTTVYEHRPTPSALMSPYNIGTDTPALRQLQHYAYTDMQRNEAINAMQPLLYPYYLASGERELRERELRERDSRERLSKLGMDIKPQDMLDPHNPNMQQLPPSAAVGLSQGLHVGGLPVSLAGPHLAASMEHQIRQQQLQAHLLSLPPGTTPHPAALAASGLPPGPIGASPFTHPEAALVERLSAERLQAERLAAEQYQLEWLHHHQHSHVHSHLHLHQPGQPGAPPPPPVPLPALPPPLTMVPEPVLTPYAAMQAAAMAPFASSAANPLLLNPAIRSQQALMHAGIPPHMHASALVGREQVGQPLTLSASQHLQAVHEQHLLESGQRARAEAVFHQQQLMAARMAGHKP